MSKNFYMEMGRFSLIYSEANTEEDIPQVEGWYLVDNKFDAEVYLGLDDDLRLLEEMFVDAVALINET